MARLAKCRGCGSRVSARAKACPHCGEPPGRRSAIARLARVAVVVLLIALGIAATQGGRGGRATSPAAGGPRGKFEVGELCMLYDRDPSRQGVWAAATLDDMPDLIDAERRLRGREGPHPGEMRTRLAEAKRASFFGNDTRAWVVEATPEYRRVEILSGEWEVGSRWWVALPSLAH